MDITREINDFNSLTPNLKLLVIEFIDNLKKIQSEKLNLDNTKKNEKKRSNFIGIWKDREDMKDSTEWVRNIRKTNLG